MSAKSATLKDPQRQCKIEGLDTTGNKAALLKRLEDNQKNWEVLSPESQDDTKCDAVLVSQSELGDEERIKEDAKDALQQALDEEELHVEDVRGKLFVGNRRGLNLAGFSTRIHALEDEVTSLKEKVTPLKEKVTSLEVKNALLEDRVSSLTISLDAYKLLRNRFISTFKRDKLGNATDADRRIIGAGNAWAHGGDAVVDASLYSSTGQDRRRDTVAYKRLYEMDPGTVLLINHKPTIDILNVHAAVIASQHKTGSARFYTLFAEFVELFTESSEGHNDSYLDGDATDVTRAYWTFLNCIKDEVTG